ncbi:hypothetical protein NW754_004641 [Fusarium falciforme]|nr:hypothetical protein NW754_004641 [Fusarium falciforme]KAJ4208339.1 hypothetical protein NW767_001443 [Fusarium falciforme]KAJ4257930.1 hypothetical protein NW757_003558 [Fusarium falciforme]
MTTNFTKVIDFFGLNCPNGGKYYICAGSWVEFMGCCTSDPCADGSGICPTKNHRPAGYDAARLAAATANISGESTTEKLYKFPVTCYGEQGWLNRYACSNKGVSFFGCCKTDPCFTKFEKPPQCANKDLQIAVLRDNEYRYLVNAYDKTYNVSLTDPNNLPTENGNIRVEETQDGLVGYAAVAGASFGALAAVVLLLGVAWKYWLSKPEAKRSQSFPMSPISQAQRTDKPYIPVVSEVSLQDGPAPQHGSAVALTASGSWGDGPKQLHSWSANNVAGWLGDTFLTLIPVIFIVLAIIAMSLDRQPQSAFGQRAMEWTRLSPTVYPIIFAAVASRFYKNLARWCLERPNGIGLAVLEQIFGSQSFAAAFERLCFVRTKVLIGMAIILTWAMSPLGGQSASRLLSFGNSSVSADAVIYYADPAYQKSNFLLWDSAITSMSSVEALYSSSLMSSLEQKRSPRDLWGLPKIPQWPRGLDAQTHNVDSDALRTGGSYYASLLGIKMHGLDLPSGHAEYTFTVETSYLDFDCKHTHSIDLRLRPRDNETAVLNMWHADVNSTRYPLAVDDVPFIVNVSLPAKWDDWMSLEDPPPLSMRYMSRWADFMPWMTTQLIVVDCSMESVTLETDMQCSGTSCAAHRQRRLKNKQRPGNRFPDLMLQKAMKLSNAFSLWANSTGSLALGLASPIENYFIDETFPYSGQPARNWTKIDTSKFEDVFSRRFTTAFNTYWDSTLNPNGHTNVSFQTDPSINTVSVEHSNLSPFMNSTTGTVKVTKDLYIANRLWIGLLLLTTMILMVLAICGLALQAFIRGPDVLGYASTLTRDNPNVPVPPGGSYLDGPDRARQLKHLRLQLADVRPQGATGYVAVRSIPAMEDDEKFAAPLDRKRLYE